MTERRHRGRAGRRPRLAMMLAACGADVRQGIRHGAMGSTVGKTHFLASESLDTPGKPTALPGPLGHPLELVRESHRVRRAGPDETGDGHDTTAYAATLLIDVPQRCPCCA